MDNMDRRKHKLNLNAKKWERFATYLESLKDRAEEYNLPFEFYDNLYGSFCSYTWAALLKDAYSLDMFRISDRDNANKTAAFKILSSFAPAPGYDALDAKITSNDIWLVEKITGNGLAHSVALMAKGIDNGVLDAYNLQRYIYSLIRELMYCKPIEVSLAVSDLVVKVINDLVVNDNDHIMNIKTHTVIDPKDIERLVERVKKSIKIINRDFEDIISTLYNFYRREKRCLCYSKKEFAKDIPIIPGEGTFVENQWEGMEGELRKYHDSTV